MNNIKNNQKIKSILYYGLYKIIIKFNTYIEFPKRNYIPLKPYKKRSNNQSHLEMSAEDGFTSVKYKKKKKARTNVSTSESPKEERVEYDIYDTGVIQCKYYVKQCCNKGDSCEYYHPELPVSCPKFQNGTCVNGNQCSLIHPVNFCKYYFRNRGQCKRGVTCKFSHNDVMIRKYKNYKRSKACKFVAQDSKGNWNNECRVRNCLYSHPSKDTPTERQDSECKFNNYCFWYIVGHVNNCPYTHIDERLDASDNSQNNEDFPALNNRENNEENNEPVPESEVVAGSVTA